jgi:hypothetical protein
MEDIRDVLDVDPQPQATSSDNDLVFVINPALKILIFLREMGVVSCATEGPESCRKSLGLFSGPCEYDALASSFPFYSELAKLCHKAR